MSKNRYSARTDINQKEIVEALRKLGISVVTGHDDILCGLKGKTFWYEIKNPKAANKEGKVFESRKKKSQKNLEKTWRGHFKIVTNLGEILADMGIT